MGSMALAYLRGLRACQVRVLSRFRHPHLVTLMGTLTCKEPLQ